MSYDELNDVIEKMQIIQENALEYKKTKRISNYSKEISILSVIAVITLLINIGNLTNIFLINSLQVAAILSIGLVIKKYTNLKAKRKQIKSKFPQINFKKYDIKENQKTILRLLAQKTQIINAERKKTRRQKHEEQQQVQNIRQLEPTCPTPQVHNQEPDTKGHVKSIGTLKRRG